MWFENSANAWGNYWILYHKTNKEASTVFCSVVKHAGSGRARKKCRGKHFLSALPLPKCFTTEQNTVEASLLVCRRQRIHIDGVISLSLDNHTLASRRVRKRFRRSGVELAKVWRLVNDIVKRVKGWHHTCIKMKGPAIVQWFSRTTEREITKKSTSN